jgi:uncharacterized membrane protein affecting hemolysin expression
MHLKQINVQVVEVSASKTGNYGHGQCHFAAIDIFTAERFEDNVPCHLLITVMSVHFLNLLLLTRLLLTLTYEYVIFIGSSCESH